jgi:hypothetical protein
MVGVQAAGKTSRRLVPGRRWRSAGAEGWRPACGTVRSRIVSTRRGAARDSLEGFSLGHYLLMLDETSRQVRTGQAPVNPAAEALLERVRTRREAWSAPNPRCLFGVAVTTYWVALALRVVL